LFCFIQGEKDISLLLNRQDLIQNIVEKSGSVNAQIIDYTIVQHKFLYLLYKQSISVLDISALLDKKQNPLESEATLVNTI
jgi:hypothetical protein